MTSYASAFTTAFGASFRLPSNPSIPLTVVYFKTNRLPGLSIL